MRAAAGKVMLIFSYHSAFDPATLHAQNAGLGYLQATTENGKALSHSLRNRAKARVG
jgi:hypothetical protein